MAEIASTVKVNGTAAEPQAAGETQLRRSDLLRQASGGVLATEHGRETGLKSSEWISFSPELKAQYKRFLTEHIALIQKVNPDILKNNPMFAQDRELLKNFVNFDTGEMKDTGAIDKFLSKPEGWLVITPLLEHQMAIKQFVLGVLPEISGGRGRPDTAQAFTGTALGEQPLISFDGRRPILPRLRESRAAKADFENRLMKWQRGSTLGLRENVQMFDSIKNDPAMRDYVLAVTGLDVDAFRINGAGTALERDTTRSDRSTVDPTKLKKELLGQFQTRNKFFDELGIPKNARDGAPELGILAGPNGVPNERLGLLYQQRIMDAWNPNDPAVAAMTPEARTKAYMEARSKVMAEMIKEYVAKPPEEPNERAIAMIDAKIIQRQKEQGKTWQVRTEKSREISELLEKDVTEIVVPEKKSFTEYIQVQAALDQVILSFDTEFPGYNSDVEAAIADRKRLLDPKTTTAGSLYKSIQGVIDTASKNKTARIGAIPGGMNQKQIEGEVRNIQQDEDAKAQNKINAYNERIVEAKKELSTLEVHRRTIFQAQRALNESNVAVRGIATELGKLADARRKLNGWGIPDARLASVSTIDALMIDVNAAYGANPAHGWGPDQNENPQNRKVILRAMADARAEEAADADLSRRAVGGRLNLYDQFVDASVGALTANELRVNTPAEIIRMTIAKGSWGGLVPTEAQAKLVKREAQERVDLRLQILDDIESDLKKAKANETFIIGQIDFDSQIEDLQSIKALLGDYPKVIENREEVIDHREDFLSSSIVTATDGEYTPAEQSAGVTKGYLKMLDYLFDYSHNPDEGREEYFKLVTRVLPEADLARTIQINLDIWPVGFAGAHVGTPPVASVVEVLGRMDALVAGGQLDSMELISLFDSIVSSLRKKALAMP